MLLSCDFFCSNGLKECAKAHIPSISKIIKGISNKKRSCFEIEFFSLGPWYRIIFVLCSIISIGTYGYFYCFCLPYVFLKIDVMQVIAKALTRRGEIEKEALILLSCMHLYMLLIMHLLTYVHYILSYS